MAILKSMNLFIGSIIVMQICFCVAKKGDGGGFSTSYLRQFAKSSEAADYMRPMMNLSADPCTDFFEYACGGYAKGHPSGSSTTGDMQINHIRVQIRQMKKDGYLTPQTPLPVRQAVWTFRRCLDWRQNVSRLAAEGRLQKRQLDDFRAATDLPDFSAFDPRHSLLLASRAASAGTGGSSRANGGKGPCIDYDMTAVRKILGAAIGYMNARDRNVMLTLRVAENSDNDTMTTHPFLLRIEEHKMIRFFASDHRMNWPDARASIAERITEKVLQFANATKTPVDVAVLRRDAGGLADLEHILYKIAEENKTDVPMFSSQANVFEQMNISTADTAFPCIDFRAMFLAYGLMEKLIDDPNRPFFFKVIHPNMLREICAAVEEKPELSPRNVFNYFNYRLLADADKHLAQMNESIGRSLSSMDDEDTIAVLGNDTADLTAEDIYCSVAVQSALPYAGLRIFGDALHPADSVEAGKRAVLDIIKDVAGGWKKLIEDITWMDADSKNASLEKLANVRTYIAFTDFLHNNTALSRYHVGLDIEENDDFFAIGKKIQAFNTRRIIYQLSLAGDASKDRWSYFEPRYESMVNAGYSPEMNSITIWAGILSPPVFHPNWPAAIQYGALGYIVGHEFGHGFDPDGIQYDKDGVKLETSILSNESSKAYARQAACVRVQFGQFCPFHNVCVDGELTVGENSADAAGLEASLLGYRLHVAKTGAEAPLNDRQFSQLTSEQLYYLGFAFTHCSTPMQPDDPTLLMQLAMDPHSPKYYRVLGTLQNNAHFRQTFNCPAEGLFIHDDTKHCNVWVRDNVCPLKAVEEKLCE